MNTRMIMAAVAATLLSTAAIAAPPSAAQVSVPQSEMRHQSRMMALFDSPDEFMMFRMEMHQATHGMAREQRKAYRKAEIQRIRAMNPADRGAYLHGLQAKWNALPPAKRERIAQRIESHGARHQARHGGQGYDQPEQGQDYQDDQMGQPR